MPISLSSLALCNNTNLASSAFLSLVARDNRIVSQAELEAAQTGDINPITLLPRGFQPVFLRGEAQTNSIVKLSESLFDGIGDYRSSLGMEVRVQVPVINVPFRLIFAYNPNARPNQFIDGFPFFFNEKRESSASVWVALFDRLSQPTVTGAKLRHLPLGHLSLNSLCHSPST